MGSFLKLKQEDLLSLLEIRLPLAPLLGLNYAWEYCLVRLRQHRPHGSDSLTRARRCVAFEDQELWQWGRQINRPHHPSQVEARVLNQVEAEVASKSSGSRGRFGLKLNPGSLHLEET